MWRPTKDIADRVARKMNKAVKHCVNADFLEGRDVIRVYAADTKETYIKSRASNRMKTDKYNTAAERRGLWILKELEERFQESRKQDPFVGDKRFKYPELSLGYKTLGRAGLVGKKVVAKITKSNDASTFTRTWARRIPTARLSVLMTTVLKPTARRQSTRVS